MKPVKVWQVKPLVLEGSRGFILCWFIMFWWITIHRKMIEWERYQDIQVRWFFLHCILRANHIDNKWMGIHIQKWQFISSYAILAKENWLSVRSIRTIIKKLKTTNELTSISTSKYTMFTVVKYWQYQAIQNKNDKQNDKQNDKPATSDRQQTTMNNNNNKYNKSIRE